MSLSPARVRELVARLPGAQEGAHHGHPDFRVQKRIFATLSEAEDRAALRLTQLEARELAQRQPTAFRLVSDREPYAWVNVLLEEVAEDEFGDLLEEAWRQRAPQDLVARYAADQKPMRYTPGGDEHQQSARRGRLLLPED